MLIETYYMSHASRYPNLQKLLIKQPKENIIPQPPEANTFLEQKHAKSIFLLQYSLATILCEMLQAQLFINS